MNQSTSLLNMNFLLIVNMVMVLIDIKLSQRTDKISCAVGKS